VMAAVIFWVMLLLYWFDIESFLSTKSLSITANKLAKIYKRQFMVYGLSFVVGRPCATCCINLTSTGF